MAKTKKETKVTNNLKVKLTTEELLAAGQELAKTLDTMAEIEDDKKSQARLFAARTAEYEAKAIQLQGKDRNKYEYRNIECIEVMDNKAGTVTTTRTDTGIVIDSRKMTVGERQMKMFTEK